MGLLLSSCAASYIGFLTASAVQLLLPGLIASWRGGFLPDEVRIGPLWLAAVGYGGEPAARWMFRYGPLLFGGLLALGAMLAARKAGRAAKGLILDHVACWNLSLLVAGVIPWILFRGRWGASVAVALIAAPLLLVAVRELVGSAAPHIPSASPRAAASILAFFIPFTMMLVVSWRANFRLPFRGPQSLSSLGAVLGALGLVSFLAAALARRPRETLAWPRRATVHCLVLAGVVLGVLAAYSRLEVLAQDRQLARISSTHYEFFYLPESYTRERVERLARERESLWPAMVARLGDGMGSAGLQARGPRRARFWRGGVETGTAAVGKEPAKPVWRPALQKTRPALPLRVFLYPTYEAKYARTHSTAPFTVEGTNIFAVLNEQLPALDPHADAEALLEATWGRASLPFLEEAATSFVAGAVSHLQAGTGSRSASDWAAEITAEEGLYSLAQLSNAEVFLSPLVREPLAAEFAAWIGRDRLRQLYAIEPGAIQRERFSLAGAADWRLPLEESWRRHLLELASHWKPAPAKLFPQTFYKGMSFSHEGGVHSGYASERAAEVLGQLRALGVDSVALMPFAFMPSPESTSLRRFSGESDPALDHMTFVAHRAGMRVLLKPQIWLRGGNFPGSIHFRNQDDFRTWWSEYRQWILHYARLAEVDGADLLAVGTELEGVSGREADWRRLIAEIRRVYHGPITYAANWGKEFETLRFWDAVDYIGLNNYYALVPFQPSLPEFSGLAVESGVRGAHNVPAADQVGTALVDSGSGVSEKALAGAARLAARLEEVHRIWNKPILFTEAGYPSDSTAAAEPWNENAAAPVDLEQQARCYEALSRAFYRRPWFAGMFWWKWSSSGYGGGPQDPSYTPQGKPAAQVIQRWFRESR